MNNFKKDFPIFTKNPSIVYLDSTASSQKPSYVINSIKDYLENDYSNIHRWLYDIAINSEKLYFDSKKKIAKFLNAPDYKEIIYTYNSNYALNLLSQTLRFNKVLKAWDKVLVSIVEHHSNIVPWLILKEEIGIELEFINVTKNFDLDINDFEKKYDDKVKIISLTHVSNVTGQIFDLEKIWKLKRDDTLFIVDASQSFPHFKVDVQALNADFAFFTGHKIMADSWIWVLWWKREFLEKYNPVFSWGWAINEVKECGFKNWAIPFRFEPWTPNMTWALSLLKALEYIEKIWGYEEIQKVEDELVKYALEKFNAREKITLVWSKKIENRVWVFSFYIDWIHSLDIADQMAEENICIRAGQHCAEPFADYLWIKSSCRMSLYIYNSFEDIDKFFDVIDNILENNL